MNVATLTVLGLSLSVDAFAAAVGKGAAADKPRFKDALRVGLYFGFFEAITPAFGWAMGLAVSSWFAFVDHWIAFTLLALVGGNMIRQGFSTVEAEEAPKKGQLGPMQLILTALATSIDATAVGVGLAVVDVNIVLACVIIGVVTTAVAFSGVLIGKKAGPLLGRRAEILGGIALIAIGIKIVIEHTSA
ncbi:manganese efflux pump MntP family protein [Lacibacterium aquatile]|uniref:Putative manganese efflux pump MntP n=1 Tax=Lacibacterium aquatile TaxID=1168082 RepID=A0ABW5DK92_9PROT